MCVFTPTADGGEVCIIERLFASSLVAMVELANPRKLRVCHFKVGSYSYWHISLGPAKSHHCRLAEGLFCQRTVIIYVHHMQVLY